MEWQQRALPVHGTLPPQDAFRPGDSAIIMVFVKRVVLSVDGTNQKILYEPGVHNVPARLADHWYLKAHGVTRHELPEAAPQEDLRDEDADNEPDGTRRRGRKRA